MKAYKNHFFQNLTLKICNSLEIENTLLNGFSYLKEYIPADGMTFDITKPDGSLLSIARVTSKRFVAGIDIFRAPAIMNASYFMNGILLTLSR